MSAFQPFDECLSQLLPELENFANQPTERIIERPQCYYPPQYGYQNYYGYNQLQVQQPQPQESYHTYQNYTYQYNQYSHPAYPYMYYSPSVPAPAPITIILPKSDQKIIKLEINMGAGGQNSQINIIQSNVENNEPESFSYQAITELLEPSDYSTVYDNEQRKTYAEMTNVTDVNGLELLAIDGMPILNTFETPKNLHEAVYKSSPSKKRLPIEKRKIKYTCSLCNHVYLSKSSLSLHVKSHKKPFCSSCYKIFDDVESIDPHCCSTPKRYRSAKKLQDEAKNKFILKTTTPRTGPVELQNWELVPKSDDVKENVVDKTSVKQKENMVGVNHDGKKKKLIKKKSIIVPDKLETVMIKSRFGRSRAVKKFC